MVGNNTDGLTHNSTGNSKATNRITNLVTVRRVGDNVDTYTHKPTVIRPSLIVHNVTARKIVTAISKTDSKKQLRLPSGTTSPSSMKKPVNRPSFIVDNVTARKIETTISKTDSTKQLRLPSGTSLSSVKKSDKVSCLAKECVAIVVPYRDRKEHLSIFMTEIERFLRQQNITFYIFIIEQSSNGPFNRAKLFNVGFNESRLISNFSCYIFHDVDLIPISPYNQYHCGTNPIHMAVGIEKYGFRLPYPVYTGGVLAMTSDQFQRMNGFSNVYFGWGGRTMISKGGFEQLDLDSPDQLLLLEDTNRSAIHKLRHRQ